MKNAIFLGLALLVANISFASEYIEASIGQTTAVDACNEFSNCENKDTNFKVSIGFKKDSGIGGELAYWDLGEATAKGFGAGAYIWAQALTAQATINSNINQNISAFAKAGFSYTDFDYTAYCFNCGVYSFSYKDSDASITPVFGIGLEVKINEKISITGSFNNFLDVGNDDIGESDIRTFNIGAKINL